MTDPFEIPLNNIRVRIKAMRPVLVKKMAAEALVFIAENFQKQGFQGSTFEPWAKRADPKDQGRPILFKIGTLFRSPFCSYSDADKAIITSSLPYSRIHNEGGLIQHAPRNATLHYTQSKGGKMHLAKMRTVTQMESITDVRFGAVGAHTTHMPKRRFMGPSPVLDQRIDAMLRKEVPGAFKLLFHTH